MFPPWEEERTHGRRASLSAPGLPGRIGGRRRCSMAYVTKKELIDKVKPLVTELSQLQEELESALERLEDLLEKIEDALEEASED